MMAWAHQAAYASHKQHFHPAIHLALSKVLLAGISICSSLVSQLQAWGHCSDTVSKD